MRYHEAHRVRKEEAQIIAEPVPSSSNVNVVISHGAWRYDFRVMTEMELEEFVAELLRVRLSELQAPLLAPNECFAAAPRCR